MTDVILISTRDSILCYDASALNVLGQWALHTSGASASKNLDAGIRFSLTTGSPPTLLSVRGPFFYVHGMQSAQPLGRCVSPAPLTCVSSSNCSSLFQFGGTATGDLYVWDASTGGELLRVVHGAHFKSIKWIKSSSNGDFVVSAGDESVVHVWNLGDLVDVSLDDVIGSDVRVEPRVSCSQHTLAVTDLKMLKGSNRFVTSSLDRSCRLWSLDSDKQGSCLMTFIFPSPVTSVCVNDTETHLFAACQDGQIWRIGIYPTVISAGSDIIHVANHSMQQQQQNGSGVKDWIALPFVGSQQHHLQHADSKSTSDKTAVNNLAMDIMGRYLYSTSESGMLSQWDVVSGQLIKSATLPKGAVPFDMLTCLRPRHLFQAGTGDQLAPIVCMPMRQLVNPSSRSPVTINLPSEPALVESSKSVVSTGIGRGETDSNLVNENEELRAQNQELLGMLDKMKEVNMSMYRDLVGK